MDAPDKHSVMFAQLVLMLHAAAMQHMGKIKSPVTDKIERDLRAAQGMIEMLDMLRARTEGKLVPGEVRMMDQILQELRLNYVDEVNKPDTPAAEGGSPGS